LRGVRDRPGASPESVSSRNSGTDGGKIATDKPIFNICMKIPAVGPAAAGGTVCLCVGIEVAAVVFIARAPHWRSRCDRPMFIAEQAASVIIRCLRVKSRTFAAKSIINITQCSQPRVKPGNAQLVTTSAGESKLPEGKVPDIVMVSTENGGTYVVGVSLPVTVTDVAPARKSSRLNDTDWASTREMAANATKIRTRYAQCAASK
jgi:hypothetical protein